MDDIKIGDFVAVMGMRYLTYSEDMDDDGTSWDGMVGIVTEVGEKRITFDSPMKALWNRPPIDSAPRSQLIRISEADGRAYLDRVMKDNDLIVRVEKGLLNESP